MGYYSSVYIAVPSSTYDEIMNEASKKIYAEENEKHCRYVRFLDTAKVFTVEDDKVKIMYWDDVRWYCSYEEVKLINSTMRKGLFAFLRIGEDHTTEYDCRCMDDDDVYHPEFDMPFNVEIKVKWNDDLLLR